MGMRPADNPKIEFRRADFDTYESRIHPYDEIINKGGTLTPEQVNELHSIKKELSRKYTPESMAKYMVGPRIDALINLDNVKKEGHEHIKLQGEADSLEIRLGEMRRAGTLTPEEKGRIYKRLCEIGNEMHPYH